MFRRNKKCCLLYQNTKLNKNMLINPMSFLKQITAKLINWYIMIVLINKSYMSETKLYLKSFGTGLGAFTLLKFVLAIFDE